MRNINEILDNTPKITDDNNRRQIKGQKVVYYPTYEDTGEFVNVADIDSLKNQYQELAKNNPSLLELQGITQAPVQQQDDNTLHLYSQTVSESQSQNQYDYDTANERYNQALGEYGQIYEPIKRSQDDYINGLNAIYERYNPDKTEPAKQDMRLAGIQALATALSDLGKATGKALGNNDGLGMVTVDNTQKFDNMFNYLKKAQQNYRNAENEKATKNLQLQLDLFKEKYKNDKDFQKAMRDYALTERNKALENSKTTRTIKNVWENPNSKEYQERQSKNQREIDKEKRQENYQNEKLSIERAKLRNQRNTSAQENKKTYSISNITYGHPKYLSSKDQKRYKKEDEYLKYLIDYAQVFQFDDESQLDSFYRSFYPTIKKINKDAIIEIKPDEQVKQIENAIQGIHEEQNPDTKAKYYNSYLQAKIDSGIYEKYQKKVKYLIK